MYRNCNMTRTRLIDEVSKWMRYNGVTLRYNRDWNEWEVSFHDNGLKTYYSTDLMDAIGTGVALTKLVK